MKTIFKNLWNRRRANAWLFIELIIVSYLTWTITDRVAVSLHDINMPMGFDIERLAIVDIKKLPEGSRGYNGENDSLEAQQQSVRDLEAKIRAIDGVERLTNMRENALPGSSSTSMSEANTGNPAIDTVIKAVYSMIYFPGTEFFETYGIKAVEGAPDAASLSAMPLTYREDVVITEDLAKLLAPGKPGTSIHIVDDINNETGDTTYTKVRGVTSGIRWSTLMRSYCLLIYPAPERMLNTLCDEFRIVVRLREGVDPAEWSAELRRNAGSLSIGNLYMASVTPYTDFAAATEDTYGISGARMTDYYLAAFFLINLVLGTIGCFWLQTRKRVGEIGVRRAFGARRGNIVGMLLAESWVLATVAVIIGCLIQLQFMPDGTLGGGFSNNKIVNLADTWVNHFGEHFMIVSGIAYVVIIVSVLIGTLIPAIHAARINVTDALRDE